MLLCLHFDYMSHQMKGVVYGNDEVCTQAGNQSMVHYILFPFSFPPLAIGKIDTIPKLYLVQFLSNFLRWTIYLKHMSC